MTLTDAEHSVAGTFQREAAAEISIERAAAPPCPAPRSLRRRSTCTRRTKAPVSRPYATATAASPAQTDCDRLSIIIRQLDHRKGAIINVLLTQRLRGIGRRRKNCSSHHWRRRQPQPVTSSRPTRHSLGSLRSILTSKLVAPLDPAAPYTLTTYLKSANRRGLPARDTSLRYVHHTTASCRNVSARPRLR
jgi:hypothetical protein